MKLFFYGTLRKGGKFSLDLPKDRKIYLCHLEGIRMYKLGWFPGCEITGKKEDVVIGEVNDFEGILNQAEWDSMIAKMDRIESVSHNLFNRTTIETPYGEAVIYLASSGTLKRANDHRQSECGKDLEIVTDWATIDEDVAKMVPTLNKEKNNVAVRTAEQKA